MRKKHVPLPLVTQYGVNAILRAIGVISDVVVNDSLSATPVELIESEANAVLLVREAADYLKITTGGVRAAIQRGSLQSWYVECGVIFVTSASIRTYTTKRRVRTASPSSSV